MSSSLIQEKDTYIRKKIWIINLFLESSVACVLRISDRKIQQVSVFTLPIFFLQNLIAFCFYQTPCFRTYIYFYGYVYVIVLHNPSKTMYVHLSTWYLIFSVFLVL